MWLWACVCVFLSLLALSEQALRPVPRHFVRGGSATQAQMPPVDAGEYVFGILNPNAESVGSRLNLGSSLLASQQSLPCVRLDAHGRVNRTAVSKTELRRALSLPSWRDLRFLDAVSSERSNATLHLAESNTQRALLLHAKHLRLVVDSRRGEAIVFLPDEPAVERFVRALRETVLLRKLDQTNDHLSAKQGNERPSLDLSLERAAISVVVDTLVSEAFEEVAALREKSPSLLRMDNATSVIDLKRTLDIEIYAIQQQRASVMYKVQDAQRLTETLLDLVDAEGDEVTHAALESSSTELSWMLDELYTLNNQITTAQGGLSLRVGLISEQRERTDLLLSMSALVVALGALVTGVFGMNLLSHFEKSSIAFFVVSGFIGAMMLFTLELLKKKAKKLRLF